MISFQNCFAKTGSGASSAIGSGSSTDSSTVAVLNCSSLYINIVDLFNQSGIWNGDSLRSEYNSSYGSCNCITGCPIPSTIPPSTVTPSTQTPSTQISSTLIHSTNTPSTLIPSTHFPSTYAPSTEIASTTSPSAAIPSTTDPSTKSPTTSLPSTQILTTNQQSTLIFSTQIPSTNIPSTSIPSTLIPSTQTPSTNIPSSLFPTNTTPANNPQCVFQVENCIFCDQNVSITIPSNQKIECRNFSGTWLYLLNNDNNETTVFINNKVSVNSSIEIKGNLNQTANSTLTFNFSNSSSPLLNVSGCVDLKGKIEIVLDDSTLPSHLNSFDLLNYNCSTPLNVSELEISLKSTSSNNSCDLIRPQLESTTTSMSVSFSIQSICKKNVGLIVGLSSKYFFLFLI